VSSAATDLLIVGGGPTGIAAAVEACALGLSVTLLDENAAPGGRIWQGLENRGAKDADDTAGAALIHRFRASPVDARWRAAAWAIEPDGRVYWSERGSAYSVTARRVLLASGAIERPLPIPGWTLPGVMTIGAAQIALKTGGLVPSGRTWLAGQGPLLLLYAAQALEAGGQLAGILDLSDGLSPFRALRRLTVAGLPDIQKGLAWRRSITQSGVPWISAAELRAEGEEALRAVVFHHRGAWRREAADLLLLHDGVIPSVQMTRAVGCAHAWSVAQRCWHPVTDAWGRTSVPRVLVAGDAAGIGGAAAAETSGRIVALGVAQALGRLSAAGRDGLVNPLRIRHGRQRASRPLLEALFAPRPMRLTDETLVCRCEEVSAGDIRRAVRDGCGGMNQLKAYTRCGMGPCQGRLCAPVAIEVLAAARGVAVPAIEPLRARFPTKPVSLEELASLRDD